MRPIWKNRAHADLRQAAKHNAFGARPEIEKRSVRRPCRRRRIPKSKARDESLDGTAMHPDLSALAEKISKVLSRVAEYVVTQPAELRVLREMSDADVSEFAKSHGWRVIRRLGGRQIEFYNDASMREV